MAVLHGVVLLLSCGGETCRDPEEFQSWGVTSVDLEVAKDHCGTIFLLPALSDSHQDVVSAWPGGKENLQRALLLALSL